MSSLTRDLRSYTKDQLIDKYNLTEKYDMNISDVRKLKKIEIMDDIYGDGLMDDDSYADFSTGGLASKKYANPVTFVDNLKKKK